MPGELTSKDQLLIFALISIWELIWKGFALWKSARNDHKIIFILLIFFNTLGIFPIGYLIYLKYSEVVDPYIFKIARPIRNIFEKENIEPIKKKREKYKRLD